MRKKSTEENSEQLSYMKPPYACHKCWDTQKGIYIATRVYLTNGIYSKFVCFKAQCPKCKHIACYGEKLGIYQYNGFSYDFNYQYWPELRELNINPDTFIEYLCNHPEVRYIPIKDLKALQVELKQRPEFYEPISASINYK